MFTEKLTYVFTLLLAVLLTAVSGVASAAAYVAFSEPAETPDSLGNVQRYRLYFACDKTSYDGSYMENELTAEAIMALLQELDADKIETVTVTSYASPEGVYEHNLMLSRLRGLCFESLAKTRFPLMNGHIRLIDGGEAWEPFRQQLFEDMQLDESVRVRILDLLDDDSVRPDTKKWRLQNRFGAETWQYILKNHFRYLRCVEIVIGYKDAAAVSADATVVTPATDETSATAADVTSVVKPSEVVSVFVFTDSDLLTDAITADDENLLPPTVDGDTAALPQQKFENPQEAPATVTVEEPKAEETKIEEPVVEEPKAEEPKVEEPKVEEPKAEETKAEEPQKPEVKLEEPKEAEVKVEETAEKPVQETAVKEIPDRYMIGALKTNLLYDLATALNFEVEVPIANRYSVMVEDIFPWWETGNKYCFQAWIIGAEGRVWFKSWERDSRSKLRGFFVGPYVMSGKFDFQFDKDVNYQGELWSVGLSAGYVMPLGRRQRTNLEFSLSMGYMQAPFRHYQPTDDYIKLIKDPANDGTFYNIFMYPTKAKISLVVPICIRKKEVNHD